MELIPYKQNIIVDGSVLEQVSNFEYLGYNVSYIINGDVLKKQQNSRTKETRMTLYKVTHYRTLLYRSEL